MATTLKGWGASWGDSWGPTTPGGMRASITFGVTLTATARANVLATAQDPRYYSVGGMTVAHRKMLMEEDEALMAILQMFVMEEV